MMLKLLLDQRKAFSRFWKSCFRGAKHSAEKIQCEWFIRAAYSESEGGKAQFSQTSLWFFGGKLKAGEKLAILTHLKSGGFSPGLHVTVRILPLSQDKASSLVWPAPALTFREAGPKRLCPTSPQALSLVPLNPGYLQIKPMMENVGYKAADIMTPVDVGLGLCCSYQ